MRTRVARGVAAVALAALFGCAQRGHERAKPVLAPTPASPTQTKAPEDDAAESHAPPVRLFASRFVAKIRAEPRRESQRIGYLRGGAVVQATSAEPVGYDKCRKGWYGLDSEGYVCATIDATPFSTKRLPERQPLQPDLTAPLPYPYGLSLRPNTPVFRRLPSDEEAAQYERNPELGRAKLIDPAVAALLAAPIPIAPPSRRSARTGVHAREPREAPPAPAGPSEVEAFDPSVPTLASLQGDEGSVLMRRMQRGFYVSLDRELEKGTRKYWRTQSNGFIASKSLLPVHGSDFSGVALKDRGIGLPVAFVISKKALAYKPNVRGALLPAGTSGYHHMLRVASSEAQGRVRYLVDDTGLRYREKDVTRIEARARPDEVRGDEKWIDIDLSSQTLVAYVGDEPVYATLISSGRIKDELDPLKNFETPSGAFRIKSKHLTATMDGDHAIDGPYSIEDVPYVMYFQLAYALHSAFWHDSFGRPHSHGCINLAPLDAKWVFEFAEPALPNAWHGVYPTPEVPGTRLYIHGTTPHG